jgi:hypothetical protein
MQGSFTAELSVNGAVVELNPFVEQFLARTVAGGVSSLRGAENIEALELRVKGGDVELLLNGEEVVLTGFPRELIKATVMGLISSLKGVDRVDSVKIVVRIR